MHTQAVYCLGLEIHQIKNLPNTYSTWQICQNIYYIIPANTFHYTILYSLYILSNIYRSALYRFPICKCSCFILGYLIEINVIETSHNYTELLPLCSLASLPHTAVTGPPSLPGSSPVPQSRPTPGPTSAAGNDNTTVATCYLILYVLYLHWFAYTIMHDIPSVIQKRIVKITIM